MLNVAFFIMLAENHSALSVVIRAIFFRIVLK